MKLGNPPARSRAQPVSIPVRKTVRVPVSEPVAAGLAPAFRAPARVVAFFPAPRARARPLGAGPALVEVALRLVEPPIVPEGAAHRAPHRDGERSARPADASGRASLVASRDGDERRVPSNGEISVLGLVVRHEVPRSGRAGGSERARPRVVSLAAADAALPAATRTTRGVRRVGFFAFGFGFSFSPLSRGGPFRLPPRSRRPVVLLDGRAPPLELRGVGEPERGEAHHLPRQAFEQRVLLPRGLRRRLRRVGPGIPGRRFRLRRASPASFRFRATPKHGRGRGWSNGSCVRVDVCVVHAAPRAECLVSSAVSVLARRAHCRRRMDIALSKPPRPSRRNSAPSCRPRRVPADPAFR